MLITRSGCMLCEGNGFMAYPEALPSARSGCGAAVVAGTLLAAELNKRDDRLLLSWGPCMGFETGLQSN